MRSASDMQAVILAGGLGTRLYPITQAIPKPMVSVAGVPFLEHQLRMLARQGFCECVLLTGYLGEQIEEHFSTGEAVGLHLRYSREKEPLGTGGALRQAASLLANDFALLYGDSYLPIDNAEVLRTLRSNVEADGVLVIYDNVNENTTVRNNIALAGDGWVARYEKDSDAADLAYVDAGVLALRRSVLDLMPSAGAFSLEKTIFPKLIADRRFLGYPTRQRFYDIGTPDRLALLERVLGS